MNTNTTLLHNVVNELGKRMKNETISYFDKFKESGGEAFFAIELNAIQSQYGVMVDELAFFNNNVHLIPEAMDYTEYQQICADFRSLLKFRHEDEENSSDEYVYGVDILLTEYGTNCLKNMNSHVNEYFQSNIKLMNDLRHGLNYDKMNIDEYLLDLSNYIQPSSSILTRHNMKFTFLLYVKELYQLYLNRIFNQLQVNNKKEGNHLHEICDFILNETLKLHIGVTYKDDMKIVIESNFHNKQHTHHLYQIFMNNIDKQFVHYAILSNWLEHYIAGENKIKANWAQAIEFMNNLINNKLSKKVLDKTQAIKINDKTSYLDLFKLLMMVLSQSSHFNKQKNENNQLVIDESNEFDDEKLKKELNELFKVKLNEFILDWLVENIEYPLHFLRTIMNLHLVELLQSNDIEIHKNEVSYYDIFICSVVYEFTDEIIEGYGNLLNEIEEIHNQISEALDEDIIKPATQPTLSVVTGKLSKKEQEALLEKFQVDDKKAN